MAGSGFAPAALLESMRPHQWIKNLLVFAPLVWAQRLGRIESVIAASITFVAFCLLASAIYLMNDLLDLERDRSHPEKRNRPLASGRLSPRTAAWTSVALVGASAVAGAVYGFWPWLLAYLAINIAYSFGLKRVVILDAMCISFGFLIRVEVGGAAIHEPVSAWLFLCTFFVALLLAFCKRRHELTILGEDSAQHRPSLEHYSPEFLDQMIAPLGALTVTAYAVYTVDPATKAKFGSTDLVYTVPFVVFGIFRYLFLVHQRAEGGNPSRLLVKDKSMLINVLLWFAVSVWIVYHNGGQAGR